jgi:hypothetical protein
MLSSPTFTTEMTGALRGFGAGVRTQRRVLGVAMVRQMAATTAAATSSRANFRRRMRTTASAATRQFAGALRSTGALLDSQTIDPEIGTHCTPGGFVITDRANTRC